MKVIIVEVTRAANSFGAHAPAARSAAPTTQVAQIVADGSGAGDASGREIDPDFVGMWFYGAIEQLLSGWVFELIPTARRGLRAGPGDGRRDPLLRARAGATSRSLIRGR